jgi:hypothetical protein
VKNFAKLALLFSLTFIISFLLVTSVRFLYLWVDWAKSLPPKPETSLTLIISAAYWALSLSLFSSILFSISYSARKNYFAPMSVLTLMCLSFVFCFGISLVLGNWGSVPPAETSGLRLGDRGLILSNSINRYETAVVMLKGTADPLGPRVIAMPGQSMIFTETAGLNTDLPPIPFNDETPWFLKNLAIDIRLNADLFRQKYSEGIFHFILQAGSIIFLLCSLGYAIKISAWPLANLFVGILVLRGILALNTFLYAPDMQEIIGSFLKNSLPAMVAVPLMFLLFGALVHLYSFLVFIVKRKPADDF